MNSAVIIKIEIKTGGSVEFTEINLTGFSGSLVKTSSRSRAGIRFDTVIQMRSPKCTSEVTKQLDNYTGRKVEIKATDANGQVHHVGNEHYPARLGYEQIVDGTPGGWNGYEVIITHSSITSYPITLIM